MKIFLSILKWIMILLLVVLIGYFIVNLFVEAFSRVNVGDVFAKSASQIWDWIKRLVGIGC